MMSSRSTAGMIFRPALPRAQWKSLADSEVEMHEKELEMHEKRLSDLRGETKSITIEVPKSLIHDYTIIKMII